MTESTADGKRGFFRDATGTKWTVGVALTVDVAATAWLCFAVAAGIHEQSMPLDAARSMIQSVGLATPDWLRDFERWLDRNGPILFGPLFLVTLILLLQSTDKRSDLLYRPATVVLAMLLCQVSGNLWPVLWLFLLLAVMSIVASLAATIAEHRRGSRADSSLDYFGSRYPSLVFLNGAMTLLPPFMLALTVVNVVREAYTLPEQERIWPEFEARLRRLQAADPIAADALRTEALLQLSADAGHGFDRQMIAHVLTRPEPPDGAVLVGRLGG